MPAEIEGRSKFGLDPARHVGRFSRVRNSIQQNSELVAAQPRDHIDFTNAALESTRDRNQQLIANRMAETIVNVLETIQIEEQHCELIILRIFCALDHECQ